MKESCPTMKKCGRANTPRQWVDRKVFLEPGEEMTVDELLRGIAIGSANDASVAMAEQIAGSEEAFVEMMNEKAKQLGLKTPISPMRPACRRNITTAALMIWP